jgi:hypothetical protein
MMGSTTTLSALVLGGLDLVTGDTTRTRIWLAWPGEELVGAAPAKDELTSWLRYMGHAKDTSFPPLEAIRLEAVPNRTGDEGEV